MAATSWLTCIALKDNVNSRQLHMLRLESNCLTEEIVMGIESKAVQSCRARETEQNEGQLRYK